MTFSWQKALGGEGAHGVLILSPRAVARLESYTPAWPMPKLFRMTKGGKVSLDIFEGATINTPSMLCVEDALDALKWAASVGGLEGMQARADQNLAVIADWVAKTPWVDFLAATPDIRSNTSVCLKVVDPKIAALPEDAQADFAKKLASLLEKGGRSPRHRRLSRRPGRPAHLVRRHGRGLGSGSPDPLAGLGLRHRLGRTGRRLSVSRPALKSSSFDELRMRISASHASVALILSLSKDEGGYLEIGHIP